MCDANTAMVTFSVCFDDADHPTDVLLVDVAVGEFGNACATLKFDEALEVGDLIDLVTTLRAQAEALEG